MTKNIVLYKEIIKDYLNLSLYEPTNIDIHIYEAMRWLCRAHDINKDGGVSKGYHLIDGWGASYPETTGYIISTFIDYYSLTMEEEYKSRFFKMANWELAIQLKNGGIPAGDSIQNPPTIFNTGQVVLGLCDVYSFCNREEYLQAAIRATDWLLLQQDDDGVWRNGGSPFTVNQINVYNTRVAWAVAVVGVLSNDTKYLKAAKKNIKWALRQQNENYWFSNNCFYDNSQPYTHTIAYALRGVWEFSLLSNTDKYTSPVVKALEYICQVVTKKGWLSGRLDRNWNGTVKWTCLTGNAQIAILLFKAYKVTNNNLFLDVALKLNTFLKSSQNIQSTNLNIRGAIKGSFPVNGKYHKFFFPNWVAKFYIDALLLENEIISKEHTYGP